MPTITEKSGMTPKSVLRHRPITTTLGDIPITTPRRSRAQQKREPHTTGGPPFVAEAPKRSRAVHWLVPVGGAMLGMLVLIWVFQIAWAWGVTTYDDLRYGRPRTFQIDAWVGHNEQTGMPSHFIALNLHRHIEIIEIPGGDAEHTRILSGPQLYGATDELTPVTLRFVDLNADHRPDMLVSFDGSRLVFINDGTSFRPLLPSERTTVEPALQRLQP